MKLNFELTKENIKKNAEKFKRLKNPKHLEILLLLNEKPRSLDKLHEIIYAKKIYLYRESTYKALEKMVSSDVIKKDYDQKTKRFLYKVNV